jgi:hypothetical protein
MQMDDTALHVVLTEHKAAVTKVLQEHLDTVRAEVGDQRASVDAAAKEHLAAMTAVVATHRAAMDGALQPLGEGVDQNRRETQYAVKRCEDLAKQLEGQIARIETVMDRFESGLAIAQRIEAALKARGIQ